MAVGIHGRRGKPEKGGNVQGSMPSLQEEAQAWYQDMSLRFFG